MENLNMNRVLQFLRNLLVRDANSYEGEFLAAASDVYDLEYRMRELDRRNRQTLMVLYR
jgi:hypothetical protein